MWYDNKASDVETMQPIFTIDQIKSFQEVMEENQINTFLCNANSLGQDDFEIERILNEETQETSSPAALTTF